MSSIYSIKPISWPAVSEFYIPKEIFKPAETGSLTSRVVDWLKGEGDRDAVLICKRIAAVALAILLTLSVIGILYLIEGIYLWQNKKVSKIEAEEIEVNEGPATQHAASAEEASQEAGPSLAGDMQHSELLLKKIKTLMEKIEPQKEKHKGVIAKIISDGLEEGNKIYPDIPSAPQADYSQIGPSKKFEDLSQFKSEIPDSAEEESAAAGPEGVTAERDVLQFIPKFELNPELEIEKLKLSKFLEKLKKEKLILSTEESALPEELLDKTMATEVEVQVEQEKEIEQVKPLPVVLGIDGTLSSDEKIKAASSLFAALLKEKPESKEQFQSETAADEKFAPYFSPAQTHFAPFSKPSSPASVSAEPLTGSWMGKKFTVLKSGTSSGDKSDRISKLAATLLGRQPPILPSATLLSGGFFTKLSSPTPAHSDPQPAEVTYQAPLMFHYGTSDHDDLFEKTNVSSQIQAGLLKPQTAGNCSYLPQGGDTPKAALAETPQPTAHSEADMDDSLDDIYR